MGSSGSAANKVHRTKTVHALVLTNNVYVATTALLEVTNGFSATANDESNSTIRHHDLRLLFTFAQSRLLVANDLGTRSSTTAGLTGGIAAVFFNDAIDLALCTNARTWATGDTTLTLRAGFWAVDELDAST